MILLSCSKDANKPTSYVPLELEPYKTVNLNFHYLIVQPLPFSTDFSVTSAVNWIIGFIFLIIDFV